MKFLCMLEFYKKNPYKIVNPLIDLRKKKINYLKRKLIKV